MKQTSRAMPVIGKQWDNGAWHLQAQTVRAWMDASRGDAAHPLANPCVAPSVSFTTRCSAGGMEPSHEEEDIKQKGAEVLETAKKALESFFSFGFKSSKAKK